MSTITSLPEDLQSRVTAVINDYLNIIKDQEIKHQQKKNELQNVTNELQQTKSQLQRTEGDLHEATTKLQLTEALNKKLGERKEELKRENCALRDGHSELKREYYKLRDRKEELKAENEELKMFHDVANDQLCQKQNRNATYTELENNQAQLLSEVAQLKDENTGLRAAQVILSDGAKDKDAAYGTKAKFGGLDIDMFVQFRVTSNDVKAGLVSLQHLDAGKLLSSDSNDQSALEPKTILPIFQSILNRSNLPFYKDAPSTRFADNVTLSGSLWVRDNWITNININAKGCENLFHLADRFTALAIRSPHELSKNRLRLFDCLVLQKSGHNVRVQNNENLKYEQWFRDNVLNKNAPSTLQFQLVLYNESNRGRPGYHQKRKWDDRSHQKSPHSLEEATGD